MVKYEHLTQLLADRALLGSVMGNLETWLLLRSLRQLILIQDFEGESHAAV
jgi:cystathionine beta-lyase/cystathionine gamma-synthase